MDPQGRRNTWGVIRALRQRGTTVLLTTHYMEEAEQLANRVAIVDRGRLVALDTPAGLRHAVSHEVRFTSQPPVDEAEVAAALGLPSSVVERENDGTLVLHIDPSPAVVARLTAWLAGRGVLLTELRAGSRSLEQAFLTLTTNGSPQP
jgi:ABC-2 type transport system ATP-binding protein